MHDKRKNGGAVQFGKSDQVRNIEINEKQPFSQFYKQGKQLGSGNSFLVSYLGAFGEVRECTSKGSGVVKAVKILKTHKMEEKEFTRLKYEVEILSNLDHPNIVVLYETFNDSKNQKFYLVTEKCSGGELFDVIIDRGQGGLSEKEAATMMK